MIFTETKLKGCFVIDPKIYKDDRGVFFESFKKNELEKTLGYKIDFVQENQSISSKGVLRGLHFQKGEAAQAKLVRITKGKVIDVVVDIRKASPTYGEHLKIELSAKSKRAIFIPKGMAHGFLALTKKVVLSYKCDNYYAPEEESGIIYNDSNLNIDWGFSNSNLLLSKKDIALPNFSAL